MAKRHPTVSRYDEHGNRRYRKGGIGITEHRAADGTVSYGAHVRLKGFKPVWQSYPSESECIAWAKQLTDELRKQRQDKNVRADLPTVTVAQLNTAYLADPVEMAKHVPQYIDALKRSLTWWSLHYGTVKVMELGVVQLREARDKLLSGVVRGGKKRSAATVSRRLAAQRSAWNWGRGAGLVAKDNLWPTRLMPREPRQRVRFLSDDELPALLTAAKEHSTVMHAAVTLSVATGLRAGELLGLTWADIDFERQRLTVLVTKNKHPKSVHLPASAISVLKALKGANVVSTTHVFLDDDAHPLTYDRLDGEWRELRKAVGLKDCRWHDLRHTCASFLAQSGASLPEIASVLGHRSLQATERYAHLVAGAPVTGHDKLDKKLRGQP